MIDDDALVDGLVDWHLIGRGGFSVVYRAHQPAFERQVAVKLLECDGTDDDVRTTVDRECAAAGRLGAHPHIVTMFDRGTASDGRPYIVMEHLARGSLHTLVGAAPLGAAALADLAAKIGGAVETSHRAGTLHRDIKPHNVLFSAADEPVLVDFGLAVVFGASTTSMIPAGFTPAFAAPELLVGHAASVATDVYGLAATLYFASTGAAPVPPDDESYVTFVGRVLSGVPAPPSGLGRRGRDALMAALAVQPPDRPTLQELIDGMTASDPERSMVLLDDITIDPDRVLPLPAPIDGLTIAPAPRTRSRVVLGAAAIALVAAGIGIGLWGGVEDRPAEQAVTAPSTTTIAPETPTERLEVLEAGSSFYELSKDPPTDLVDTSTRLSLATAGLPDVAATTLGVPAVPLPLPNTDEATAAPPAIGRTWTRNKRDEPACHGMRSRDLALAGYNQGLWQAGDVYIATYLWQFTDHNGLPATAQVADGYAAGALQLGADESECSGFDADGFALDGNAVVTFDDLASTDPQVPTGEMVIRTDTDVPIGPTGTFTFRFAYRMVTPIGDRLLRVDLYTSSATPPSPAKVKAFLVAAREQVARS